MSAKKSPKGASEKKTSATADPKRAEAPVAPVRNPCNPLPADAVGPRLLVCLKAEKIIEKLKLKENWEDPSGWDFEVLCALVASEMGSDWVSAVDKQLLKAVSAFHSKKEIDRIKKKLAPKLVDEVEGVVTVLAETISEYLILGLGTKDIPLIEAPSLTNSARIQHTLADLMEVPPSAVNPRTFERAKREVMKRYATHLAKQQIRAEKRGKPAAPPKSPRRKQTSLLSQVFGELFIQGKLSGKTGSRISGRVPGVFPNPLK